MRSCCDADDAATRAGADQLRAGSCVVDKVLAAAADVDAVSLGPAVGGGDGLSSKTIPLGNARLAPFALPLQGLTSSELRLCNRSSSGVPTSAAGVACGVPLELILPSKVCHEPSGSMMTESSSCGTRGVGVVCETPDEDPSRCRRRSHPSSDQVLNVSPIHFPFKLSQREPNSMSLPHHLNASICRVTDTTSSAK